MPIEHVRALEQIAQQGRRPDLTLLLDAPVELAMDRSRQRGAQNDRFEAEQAEFFRRVRQGYLDIAAREPERVLRVDAAREVEPVAADIQGALHRLREGVR